MPIGSTGNVFSIPNSAPFLRTMANAILDGKLFAGKFDENKSIDFSRITIYLPTRRAARALRAEFAFLLGGKASLLPTIRTLGDSDEEEFIFVDEISEPALSGTNIIDPLERQIQLARLVRKWVDMIGEESRRVLEGEHIIIPSSSAEALWLANQVGSLIDQLTTEEIPWTDLDNIVPQEYAHWWGLSLDFLKITAQNWPLHLQETNGADVAQFRSRLLDARSANLKNLRDPVIVAGSTGSIPATARFLKAVSDHDYGAVILPGVDFHLEPGIWNQIAGSNDFKFRAGKYVHSDRFEDHPQFGLAQILSTLGVERNKICQLGQPPAALKSRSTLNSIAMLPSMFTDQWHEKTAQIDTHDIEKATENISLINAPGERQEAMAVALVLRKALETPEVTAALVTPDRNLARRVKAELTRFNLEVDDSGGVALGSTNETTFVQLILSVVTGPNDGVALAALIKHRQLFNSENIHVERHAAALFEFCMIRDNPNIARPGEYAIQLDNRYQEFQHHSHLNEHIARMSENDWEAVKNIAELLDAGFAPLAGLENITEETDISVFFSALKKSAITLGSGEGNTIKLFDGPAGEQLLSLLDQIAGNGTLQFSSRLSELPAIFRAMTSGKLVRSRRDSHPRLAILGPLEARLQTIDLVVLGALNEGSWPQSYDNGPFLSRPMKSAIGLSTPERRTGLAAHDFEQLLGVPNVVISRSERVDNAPTVQSRWLQRFMTVVGTDASSKIIRRGESYLKWAQLLDQPPQMQKRIDRPCPRPAVKSRPASLSITEIETWIRDPYAIYAKRILDLKPIPDFGIKPEPMLRGIILHDAIAAYISSRPDIEGENAHSSLMGLISGEAKKQHVPGHLLFIWLPRFDDIAFQFISHERQRASLIDKSFCEIDGKTLFTNGAFELRGRADRIDLMRDGSVQIIDYKTGDNPSKKMAKNFAPQLTLEGAMAMDGGFSPIHPTTPSSLEYVRLKGMGKYKTDRLNDGKLSAEELSNAAREKLEKHILNYSDKSTGYLSRYAVMKERDMSGDYDHLARAREWSRGYDSDEGISD